MISDELKKLFPKKFWLYVDGSEKSKKAIEEAKPFTEAGMVVVYNIYTDGGLKSSDVPLPRLLITGDVMAGSRISKFFQHLRELNQELLQEAA